MFYKKLDLDLVLPALSKAAEDLEGEDSLENVRHTLPEEAIDHFIGLLG